MADPRRLFDAKDMAGAILYAKRLAASEDAYPLLVDSDGSLIVSLTSGTVSIDTAGLATSVGQTTHTTLLTEISTAVRGQLTIGTVTLNTTAVTVSNAVGNPLNVALPAGSTDSFGHIVTAEINNDIDVQFYRATSDSDLSNIITETETSGGTCSRSNGMATFAATTTSGSRAKGVSLSPVVYTAGAEVYAIFTAAFPTATGGTGSYRRIGLYNDLSDGLFIGYETTGTFGLSIVKGGSQTTTLQANFSTDTLVGGAGSKFTRAGTPEAIDPTKLNVFRIRFGWLGSAPLKFEVLSPDGNWVLFHTILQPNLADIPSLNTADLSFTCDVAAGTSGNAQTILSNCWGAGTTQKLRKLSDTINVNTLSELSRSVITAYSTAGGGAFVNVKADPSGALNVAATLSTTGATITNAVGNPVNVSLTSTVVTVQNVQAGFNVNIATATLGTVTTSLSSTLVTVAPQTGVNFNNGSVGATGSATPSSATQIGGYDSSANLRAARVIDTDSGAGAEYHLGVNLRAIASGGSVEAGTAANPFVTSLNSTVVTSHVSPSASVVTVHISPSASVVTVKSSVAGFNVNIATATLGTVTTSLSSTIVTAQISATSSVVTAHLSPTTTRVSVTMITGQNGVSASVGATDASTQRTVIANDTGRTLTRSTGSLSGTIGSLSITPTNSAKVYAYSLSTTSASEVICIFYDGGFSTARELWRVSLMAPAGTSAGANLAVSPPGWFFKSRTASGVCLSLSTAALVHYSIAWYDEA